MLTLGIALRVVQWLSPRPLWLDEAWLALNTLSRPFAELVQPLSNRQMSPLGFLWGEWLTGRLLGTSEMALRLIPLVVGVLTLVAFNRLARRLLDTTSALVATALAVLSPLLIRYSAEVKSYGLDALMAILLVLATLDLAEAGPTRRALVRWSAIALLAVLVSIPAPFVIAGCALGLLLVPEFRRPLGLARLGAAGVPAALAFTLQLITLYRSQDTAAFMERFWTDRFLDLPLRRAMGGLVHGIRSLIRGVLFGPRDEQNGLGTTTMVAMLFSVVGLLWLARQRRFTVVLLLLPSLLAVFASLAHRWPLASRLLLFAAPVLFLAVTAGLRAIANLLPSRAREPAFLGAATVLIGAMAIGTVSVLRDPSPFVPVPAVMDQIGRDHGPSATAYITARFVPACTYYAVWHPDRARLVGDSAARRCTIRGVRTVLGSWPPDTVRLGSVLPGEHRASHADWARSELYRILLEPTDELWVVTGGIDAPAALLPVVEAAGAVRTAERQDRNIMIYRYLMPARAAPP